MGLLLLPCNQLFSREAGGDWTPLDVRRCQVSGVILWQLALGKIVGFFCDDVMWPKVLSNVIYNDVHHPMP
jgi:hypothetical protein